MTMEDFSSDDFSYNTIVTEQKHKVVLIQSVELFFVQ